ncbi:MAG: acetyltransferase [Pleurocapsa sp. MO_226.B13]|nr:acetyltransferase [Pleurocapsa sp. MO_226.B13]
MFLKSKSHGELVEILEVQNLYDPFKQEVLGRFHAGQEMQDPETFMKSELVFPSGEALPQCWLDSDYKHILHKESKSAVAST